MGKVRPTIKNDLSALAQWVGRKLCNHNPMQMRDSKKNQTFLAREPSTGKNLRDMVESPTAGAYLVDEGDRNQVLYRMANGRRFMISIVEMDPSEKMPALKAVGL